MPSSVNHHHALTIQTRNNIECVKPVVGMKSSQATKNNNTIFNTCYPLERKYNNLWFK